jgi:hypothetical protein
MIEAVVSAQALTGKRTKFRVRVIRPPNRQRLRHAVEGFPLRDRHLEIELARPLKGSPCEPWEISARAVSLVVWRQSQLNSFVYKYA